MARIRSIKPEFCTSEQVVECSPTARLLFVQMWMFCDDAGRHPFSAKRLKMECYPGDDFTQTDIAHMIEELISAGLLIHYEVEDRQFLSVTGWHHQKIDKPTYKYPPFDEQGNPANLDDHSTIIRRVIDDSSPPDRTGEESTGEESTGDSSLVERSTSEPAVLVYPTVGKIPSWDLTQSQIDEWAELYPALDVLDQCRRALAFVKANPSKKKTARGMTKYLNGWLSRTTDNGRASRSQREITLEELDAASEAFR